MSAADTVKKFMRAGETGDWQTFADCMADDYVFTVHTIRQGKREMLSSQKAMWAAFPDLSFNLHITAEQGNVVKATFRITGTHTGTLIPPVPGSFLSINPTGKKVSLPENTVEYIVRGDTIAEQHVTEHPNSGWKGILKQLGVDDPYA
jgi:predicted ester cyclase